MKRFLSVLPIFAALCLFALPAAAAQMTVTDSLGRSVTIPASPERIIGSGSGALRLITYLQARDRVVALDSAEQRVPALGYSPTRPTQIGRSSGLPGSGVHGHDNPGSSRALTPGPRDPKVSPSQVPTRTSSRRRRASVVGFGRSRLSDKKEEFTGPPPEGPSWAGSGPRRWCRSSRHLAKAGQAPAGHPEETALCYIGVSPGRPRLHLAVQLPLSFTGAKHGG